MLEFVPVLCIRKIFWFFDMLLFLFLGMGGEECVAELFLLLGLDLRFLLVLVVSICLLSLN